MCIKTISLQLTTQPLKADVPASSDSLTEPWQRMSYDNQMLYSMYLIDGSDDGDDSGAKIKTYAPGVREL